MTEGKLPSDSKAMDSPPLRASARRRRLYALIACGLPFLLLLAAEGGLRLAGYGGYPPVIKHVGSDGRREWYSTYRPGVDSFFYTRLSHTGGMRSLQFTTPKPPDTVRILLLGGSAMQGYPHPLPLTNGAFLEAMLNDAWAGQRRAEVLNLGATAMASFPALHFLREMLDHEVDLVVIMTGNNEFYGAYGVASLHTAGTSPGGMRWARRLRGLGLTQALGDLCAKPPPVKEVRGQPLMQRVAVDPYVGPDDPLRQRAVASLAANLREMVTLCGKNRVPVVVCTVPTNERDLAPIGRDNLDDLSPATRERFDALLDQAEAAATPLSRRENLVSALALWDRHARTHYLLGRTCVDLGDDAAALVAFDRARALDSMPWRALPAVNAVIRGMGDHGATVCDMEAAMREASPHGAIGWELMADHVHMTLAGQALFAHTITRCLTDMPAPLHVDPQALDGLPRWEFYAERLGRNVYNDYVAASRMRTLFEIPFLATSNPNALARVSAECDRLLSAMSPRDREAAEHWHDPGLHVSNHRPLTFVVGYYRMMDGDYAGAASLFEVARASVPPVSLWRLQLGWYELKCRRQLHGEVRPEDRPLLEETIDTGLLLNRFVGFLTPLDPAYLGMTYNLAGEHENAIALLDNAVRYAKGVEGWDMVRALADSLVHTGQIDRARLLLELAQKDPVMAPPARRLLAQLDVLAVPTDKD